jgi:RNA polymerase sigma factor (sigma-70 family)
MRSKVSHTALGWYLDQIKSTPLLTAEQERDLARRIREHSDPHAREQMIAANLRLVVKIAKQYATPGMTLGDLVAEGNIGLMRAVEEFDPDAGVRFSTYAAWWVKQAIKRAMIQVGQPIRIPAYLVKMVSKWRKAAAAMEARLGRPPTAEEMAKKLRISRRKAEILRHGLQAAAAPSQISSDETSAIAEMVGDGGEQSPDQALLDASNSPIVQALLKRLEPRERRILELRFGLDGHQGPPRTFKEIGKIVGLTRERVRQLEKKALASLKALAEQVA